MPEGRPYRRRSMEPPRSRFAEADGIREAGDRQRLMAEVEGELRQRGLRPPELRPMEEAEGGGVRFRPRQESTYQTPEQLVEEILADEPDQAFRQDVERAVSLLTAQGWVPTRRDIEALADTIDEGATPEQAARRFRMTKGLAE